MPDCDRRAYAKHLCNAHYIRKRLGKPMAGTVRRVERGRVCRLPECRKPHYGDDLCKRHYGIFRRATAKTALVEMLGGACSSCGGVYPVEVYDFHHRNPKEKSLGFGNSIGDRPLATLKKEAAKCDLLCANCHRIEHAKGYRSVI